MRKLALLLLLTTPAYGKVRDLSLDIKRMPYNRDLLFPDRLDWQYETRFNADVDLGQLFMDNEIIGRTYDSRYRYVGWKFDLGLHVNDWLDVVHSHYSQHAIDLDRPVYPVVDSYGVRIHFTERSK